MSLSVGVVVRVAASSCGCATTLLAAAVITSLSCFSISCDLLLAVESCVLLVVVAGWNEGASALGDRC